MRVHASHPNILPMPASWLRKQSTAVGSQTTCWFGNKNLPYFPKKIKHNHCSYIGIYNLPDFLLDYQSVPSSQNQKQEQTRVEVTAARASYGHHLYFCRTRAPSSSHSSFVAQNSCRFFITSPSTAPPMKTKCFRRGGSSMLSLNFFSRFSSPLRMSLRYLARTGTNAGVITERVLKLVQIERGTKILRAWTEVLSAVGECNVKGHSVFMRYEGCWTFRLQHPYDIGLCTTRKSGGYHREEPVDDSTIRVAGDRQDWCSVGWIRAHIHENTSQDVPVPALLNIDVVTKISVKCDAFTWCPFKLITTLSN